jgi:hypothetical protein
MEVMWYRQILLKKKSIENLVQSINMTATSF